MSTLGTTRLELEPRPSLNLVEAAFDRDTRSPDPTRAPARMTFRDEQIELLINSGWSRCGSVAAAVRAAALPVVTSSYLKTAFSAGQWQAAEHAAGALRDHFKASRFADEVSYGVVLVPDPAKFDTRRSMDPAVRQDQLGKATADVFDERLPIGCLGVQPGCPWTLVVTVAGAYGPSCGSFNDVVGAKASAFTVAGFDTRRWMIRQIWGARVLQSGSQLPDCEANSRWTFTLFPGEALCDGLAESGTILKGRVRFRLGKPDRAIGSARVAPALVVG